MLSIVWVGIGGFVGSSLRYACSLLLPFNTHGFPLATFLVNIAGSFAIGCTFSLSARSAIADDVRLLLGVGVCGGFTTFSALSLETVALIRDGYLSMAAFYLTLSIVVGICATYAGILAMR